MSQKNRQKYAGTVNSDSARKTRMLLLFEMSLDTTKLASLWSDRDNDYHIVRYRLIRCTLIVQ